MRTSESQVEITKALVAFKREPLLILKGSTNPHFNSKFADLADIKDPADPALAKHGLVLTQHPETIDGELYLTSRLMHVSGEWQESTMELYVPKSDAQSAGSALTYGKRQAYTAITGVAPRGEDDDGQAATDRGPVRVQTYRGRTIKTAEEYPNRPEGSDGAITTKQVNYLRSMLAKQEITDDIDVNLVIGGWIGRGVDDIKTLSKAEASTAIEKATEAAQ